MRLEIGPPEGPANEQTCLELSGDLVSSVQAALDLVRLGAYSEGDIIAISIETFTGEQCSGQLSGMGSSDSITVGKSTPSIRVSFFCLPLTEM